MISRPESIRRLDGPLCRSVRRLGDRGATLVEAAFALPIFFLLALGLIDFGLLAFNNNQVANAARDGARAGIIRYETAASIAANVSDPSSTYNAIKTEIESKLPGQTLAELNVECRTPADGPVDCTTARAEVDRLRVEAKWDYDFVSPVATSLGFTTRRLTGESTMVLIGGSAEPSTPTPPPLPECDELSVAVSPDPVKVNSGSGHLMKDLSLTISYTGVCDDLTVVLQAPGGYVATVCGPSGTECIKGSNVYKKSSVGFWNANDRPYDGTAQVSSGADTSTDIFTLTD